MAAIRIVKMRYHHEGSTWWAESPDLAGFTAAGDSFEEVRRAAHEGVGFYFEEELEEGISYVLFDVASPPLPADFTSVSWSAPAPDVGTYLGAPPTYAPVIAGSQSRSAGNQELADA